MTLCKTFSLLAPLISEHVKSLPKDVFQELQDAASNDSTKVTEKQLEEFCKLCVLAKLPDTNLLRLLLTCFNGAINLRVAAMLLNNAINVSNMMAVDLLIPLVGNENVLSTALHNCVVRSPLLSDSSSADADLRLQKDSDEIAKKLIAAGATITHGILMDAVSKKIGKFVYDTYNGRKIARNDFDLLYTHRGWLEIVQCADRTVIKNKCAVVGIGKTVAVAFERAKQDGHKF